MANGTAQLDKSCRLEVNDCRRREKIGTATGVLTETSVDFDDASTSSNDRPELLASGGILPMTFVVVANFEPNAKFGKCSTGELNTVIV